VSLLSFLAPLMFFVEKQVYPIASALKVMGLLLFGYDKKGVMVEPAVELFPSLGGSTSIRVWPLSGPRGNR
jgi:hypothetical protein